MVAPTLTCSECGGGIPSDARTLGLCPRCLLSHVVEPGDGAGGRMAGRRAFAAPDVDDLADEFPRLQVLEFLGQGGMGAVYRARQTDLNREVALKIIPAAGHPDPAFAERFGREARALASLSHPNIVAAYEFGRSRRYDYLLMELVRGPSLRELLQAVGEPKPLPPTAAVRLTAELGDALNYAHQRGVTHRDIKPENILIEFAGDPSRTIDNLLDGGWRVRVVDFGLAKLREPDSAGLSLTAADQRVGTGVYMAPEQLEGRREVDARADVYSVGVVLYEMLTGGLPVGRFPPPSQTPGVSRRFDRVVWRCLEKDPARRYPDVASLCRDLEPLAGGRARRPVLAAVAGGLGVLAAAGLSAWIVHTHHRTAPHAGSLVSGVQPVPSAVASLSPPPTTQILTRPPEPPAPAPATKPAVVEAPAPAVPIVPVPFAVPDFGRRPAFPGMHPLATSDDWHRDLVQRHGAGRVVSVRVDGLPGDVGSFVRRRLGEISGAGNLLSSGSADSLTVEMAPVSDIRALAGKIDFGTVRRVDETDRVIEVLADPAKLPTPLPPAATDPHRQDYLARNVADLGAWDADRRRAALRRLKDVKEALPDDLRPRAVEAVKKLLSDPDGGTRKDAIDAFAVWAGGDAVEPLAGMLDDSDHWVRLRAAEALGKTGDARAAGPLAKFLSTDRHAASEALKALGPVAEPAVRERLGDADLNVRTEAARLLGEIGTADSLPALEQAAASGESRLRGATRAAIEAIRKRTGPRE